jgi:hypothetical protein
MKPRMTSKLLAGFMVLAIAAPAAAQTRAERQVKHYQAQLQQCLGRATGRASAQPEATRDTVADYAAKSCEGPYIKQVTSHQLMEPAQARIEVNTFAYQLAERVLSH